MGINKTYQNELKNIAKYGGINFFGIFFVNIIGYVINIIITRNVDVELLGQFILSMKIVSYIGLLSLLGFNIASIKYLSQYFALSKHSEVLGTMRFIVKWVAITSIILTSITYFFSPFIADKIFHKPEISNILRALLITVPFVAISKMLYFSLRGLKLIKYEIISSKFIEPFIRLLMLLTFFYFGYKLSGLIAVQIIIPFFSLTYATFFLYKKYLKTYPTTNLIVHKKELLSFSFPIYIKSFIANTSGMIPMYLMGIFISSKEIGIFHICSKVSILVTISLISFNAIIAPIVSSLFAKKDKITMGKIFKVTTKWIITISLAIFFIILIYSETILSIFGEEYISGRNLLLIIMYGQMINVFSGSNGLILNMSGRSKLMLNNSIISFVIIAISAHLLIPKYGAVGAAIAIAINILVMNTIKFFQVLVLEKMHPYKWNFWKPILAGILSYIAVYFYSVSIDASKIVNLLSGLMIFTLLFAFILVVLKFDEDDKIIFNAVKNRFNKGDNI